jgi:hypothetical protein
VGSMHPSQMATLLFGAILALASAGAVANDQELEKRLQQYVQATSATLLPQVRDALEQIESTPRQMLALRSYLRAGTNIEDRWSWSEEQIKAFSKTKEYRALVAEVQGIKDRFQAENPGYTLYANTAVRSIDVQIERWNRNRSVSSVAEAIVRAARKELSTSEYSAEPDASSTERFANFLRKWQPTRPAALAAPGLSKHGQLRAIDFIIFKEGKLVAPTELASAEPVWEQQGWSAKLKRATADTQFVGPLRSPHEPWHYEYVPQKQEIKVAQKCSTPTSSTRC